MIDFDSTCVFCKIYSEKQEKILFENSNAYIIFDNKPFNNGHLLVISKNHCKDAFSDIKKSLSLFNLSLKIGERLQLLKDCTGVNYFQNNNTNSTTHINHLHFHIVPTFIGDNFTVKTFSDYIGRGKTNVENHIAELLNNKYEILTKQISLQDLAKSADMVNRNIDRITNMSRRSLISPEDVQQWYHNYSTKEDFVVLARNNDGEVIGSAHVNRLLMGKNHCGKLSIVVDHNYQNMGIGNLLIDNLKKECVQNGVTRIEAEPSTQNTLAISFLTKNGFKTEGLQINKLQTKDSRLHDCLLMSMII